jgi:hypothetical protein
VTPQQFEARVVVESLRCGVANPRGAAALGTTQAEVEQEFRAQLDRLEAGAGCQPIVFEASFGEGKSHLLQYLRHVAEARGFVTSFVVVGPDTPLGKAPVVLREIARQATAPGRTGQALRELATDYRTSGQEWEEFRGWVPGAGVDERFRALLHCYEEMQADEEFRVRILDDIQGAPAPKGEIVRRLRELGQAAAYDSRGWVGKQNSLAHDRIRVLARFFRALGSEGVVVLFDEVERVANFTRKQRVAALSEVGWWQSTAEEAGSAVLPVFAHTTGFIDAIQNDFAPGGYGSAPRDSGTQSGSQDEMGARLLAHRSMRLRSVAREDVDAIRYQVRDLYQRAYDVRCADPPARPATRTLRTEIRYWITAWDLARRYPDYHPDIKAEELQSDTREFGDDELMQNGNGESAS